MKVAVWIVLYLGITYAVCKFSLKNRAADPVGVAVNAGSYLMTVFIASIAVWFIHERVPLTQKSEADIAIVVHVVLTLLSCSSLLVWSGVHVVASMVGPRRSLGRAVALVTVGLVAFATIGGAIWDTDWFVNRAAYETDTILPFVWPGTIDAPISYFRFLLSFASALGLWAISSSDATSETAKV